jgi:Potential Queuosine, Q, salvage protein family
VYALTRARGAGSVGDPIERGVGYDRGVEEYDVPPDPLGVLTTTKPVVEAARHVRIDAERVEAVAEEIAAANQGLPAWDDGLHYRDGTWHTAGWVLALDALNFCFWSRDPDPRQRWRVEYRGELYDGYWALAAALQRAVEEGRPVWDPSYLVGLSPRDVAHILRPHDLDFPEIPLFPARVVNLHELGRGLLAAFPDTNPTIALIEGAGRSAARLVERVVSLFPSFNDVATYDGREVRFYKRAQILVADLHGAFAGAGLGAFDDLEILTAFADYKVPQVLRRLGLIAYDDELAATVDKRVLLPTGSPAEVEIRAATVWGCELVRRALAARARPLRAFEVDWALWRAGQSLPTDARPYHRTYTVFY